ncbi:MAG: PAS domain S-box protein [Thermoplasmatota archaeon]
MAADGTVLVVDDKQENRYLLKTMLEGEGYQVVTAPNGKKALEELRRDGIDLIISDILMPGMDGFQLCRKCKQDEKTREIPFVFYTATYTDKKDEEFALKLGADAFIRKPQEPDHFIALIAEVTKEKQKADAAPDHPETDEDIFKVYSERLVSKLEDKVEQLRESERKMRTLLGNLPGMAYRCRNVPEWTMEFLSKGCRQVTGYEPEEVMNDNVVAYGDIIQPDDREMVWRTVQQGVKAGERFELEYRIITKQGEERWVWERGIYIASDEEPAILEGFISDITERKKAEEKLQKSEGKYRNLFETMSEGVVYQDAEGNITSANPAAQHILGLSLEQMQGKTSMDPRWKAVDKDGNELPGEQHPAMVALRTGEKVENFVQGIFVPERDEYVWLLVNSIPQFEEGSDEPYQVYSTFLDITERKQAEEEMERALETERVFKLQAAHHFFNPIAISRGYMDIAMEKLPDAEAETIQKAHDAIMRIQRVVENIVQRGEIHE